MGGLFVDVLLYFFVKDFLRFVRFVKSTRWERATASISRCDAVRPFWGCPSAQVHYRIGSSRGSQEECEDVPFILSGSATRYAQRFSAGQTVFVRVNPGDKTQTLFFAFDQK